MQQISWWQAVILGLTQGLTEFIPVSSSAHLNIMHWLFGQDRKLAFDVILHIGTLAALAFYFRRDWVELLFGTGASQSPAAEVSQTPPDGALALAETEARDIRASQVKLRNLVLIACVPAAIMGVLLRKLEDQSPLKDVWFNAVMLIVAGLVLGAADKTSRQDRTLERLNLKDALIIGGSQALALMPGVSRSGATLTAGLLRSFSREAAARFSFLMSLPITLGAVASELYKVLKEGGLGALNAPLPVILLGVAVSGASGFWAIGFLLNFLKTRNVMPFVIWRIAVALMVFALLPFKGAPKSGMPPAPAGEIERPSQIVPEVKRPRLVQISPHQHRARRIALLVPHRISPHRVSPHRSR